MNLGIQNLPTNLFAGGSVLKPDEVEPDDREKDEPTDPGMNREKAMDVLLKYEGLIDSISSPTRKEDGNYNLRDLQNIAESPDAPPELRQAAKFAANDEGLMRDIDGEVTQDKPNSNYSDGNFSWDDMKKASEHTKDEDYKFTGYGGGDLKLKTDDIDNDSKQRKEGNCFMLAATQSLSNSKEGKEIIKDTIKPYDDGSFGVTFKGDKDHKEYIVKPDGKFNSGDLEMNVINAAADQFYKDHGRAKGITAGGLTEEATQLLTGKKSEILGKGKDSAEDIEKKLREVAPDIGKDKVLTLAGKPGKDGNMGFGNGISHAVSISDINTKTGMVTYRNPWDTSVERTVKISELSEQLASKADHPGQGVGGYLQIADL